MQLLTGGTSSFSSGVKLSGVDSIVEGSNRGSSWFSDFKCASVLFIKSIDPRYIPYSNEGCTVLRNEVVEERKCKKVVNNPMLVNDSYSGASSNDQACVNLQVLEHSIHLIDTVARKNSSNLFLFSFNSFLDVVSATTHAYECIKYLNGRYKELRSSFNMSGGVNYYEKPFQVESTNHRILLNDVPRAVVGAITLCFLPLSGADGIPAAPIEISDLSSLTKIGKDKDYPLDGTYIQTENIDASTMVNNINVFEGEYNGDNHLISNLGNCLFQNIQGEGYVSKLQLENASISSQEKPTAVLACVMKGNSKIEHVSFQKCNVTTSGDNRVAAIGVANMYDNSVLRNLTASECGVNTYGKDSDAGIGVGSATHLALIDTLKITRSDVSTNGYSSSSAIGIGLISDKSKIINVFTEDCSATTTSSFAYAGVGAGQVTHDAQVNKVNSKCSNVITSGDWSHAGIGAGLAHVDGIISDIKDTASFVSTSGNSANGGIGVGGAYNNVDVSLVVGKRSRIKTSGNYSDAAVGGGGVYDKAKITNIISQSCEVSASGKFSDVGVAAGGAYNQAKISNANSDSSKICASGQYSKASLGVGRICEQASVEMISSSNSSKAWGLQNCIQEGSQVDACEYIFANETALSHCQCVDLGAQTAEQLSAGFGTFFGFGGALCFAGYYVYQIYLGKEENLSGRDLYLYPFTKIKDRLTSLLSNVPARLGTAQHFELARQEPSIQEPIEDICEVEVIEEVLPSTSAVTATT